MMNDEHTERKFAAYFLLGWGKLSADNIHIHIKNNVSYQEILFTYTLKMMYNAELCTLSYRLA